MSGGWAVTGRRGERGITRSAQALARKNGDAPRVACPGLDGQGVADPGLKKTSQPQAAPSRKVAYGPKRSAGQPATPRPVKRAAAGASAWRRHQAGRGTDCPRRGVPYLLREGSLPKAETRHPTFGIYGCRQSRGRSSLLLIEETRISRKEGKLQYDQRPSTRMEKMIPIFVSVFENAQIHGEVYNCQIEQRY